MCNNIDAYNNKLDDIVKDIEKDFTKLTKDNFLKLLTEFGYLLTCIVVDKYITTGKGPQVKGYVQMNNSKTDDIENEIDKIKNYTGLYIFKENSEDHLTSEEWQEFKTRMSNNNNNVPQWNSKADQENKIFYLGKSNRIGQRIKEHILQCSRSTYALKLNNLRTEENNSFKYKIFIFYLESDDNNRNNAVTELVESILHRKLSPKIGTRR